MRVASKMRDLGTETAFEMLAKARALEAQGREIIHMEIGEPDFDTPAHIVEAGVEALRQGYTHYGPTPGLPELREAIARNVGETRGIDVSPDRVVVTPGAKPIMFFTILALAQRGVEVIYPNPGFPIFESMIRFCGAKAVPMPLLGGRGYHPDPGGPGRQNQQPHQANYPQLAPESHRLRDDQGGAGDHLRPAPGARRHLRAIRRGVQRHHIQRGAPQHCFFPWHGGPHNHPGRLLQELRHDGMAARLRRVPGAAVALYREAGGQ